MDAILLQIFATEQSEHIERIRALVDSLPTLEPEVRAPAFDELLRRAHTLKGAARAVGLEHTERLVHQMETVFANWRKLGLAGSAELIAPIHRALDGAEDILASQLGTRSAPDTESLLRALGSPERPDASPVGNAPAGPPMPSPPHDLPSHGSIAPATASSDFVRVRTALLDDIVNSASQLVQAAYDASAAAAQSTEHADTCGQLTAEYARLRRNCSRYLRQHTGDPEVEPLAEMVKFLDDRLPALTAGARRLAAAEEQQGHTMRRLIAGVNEHARQARMIPAEAVFGSFGAMVRELAGGDGKEITYRSHGLDLQADRHVLQGLKDAVIHVLRNAVSHGIEPPAERIARRKTAAGTITLTVDVRELRFAVTVEDDGRGLDLAALSRVAVQHGAISEAAAAAATPESLSRLIFVPGLSTSDAVTPLSGRGVGLSAVAQAAAALQGEVRVQYRPGGGTTITIAVPMSILTQHVLIVREGSHCYGIPATFVRQLHRFGPSDVRLVDGVESVVLDSNAVPLVSLATLIGLPGESENKPETALSPKPPFHQAVILDSGNSSVALVVSQLLDSRERLVKPTGLPPFAAGWSVGAVPLEDGSVAVMLAADRLVRQRDPAVLAAQARFHAPATAPQKIRILVVDDSVTTRSMERSLLEANGYDVEVAVDGAEAWSKIRTNPPRLVISDVNMPNMDGFQLLEKIKTSAENIPVILVTSLESREEQERGLLLGADAYIVKRKFDHRELLRVVRQIL